MKIKLEFKLQDIWIGVFWKTRRIPVEQTAYYAYFDMWICLIPMFPIHISKMEKRYDF